MPHKKTTAELQELGRVLYRRKEYAKALQYFTDAITSEPNLTVSLLDNRAATYDKLDDVTSALKDAKNAIRLHEKDPTGYLRAGRLLQKAGKHEVALGIYKHGIKKKTRNVELLLKEHDKLLRLTATSKAADPFAQLPIELVEILISNLSFRQIVNCTRVSKQWNTLISSLPDLWKNLDLSEAKRLVKNDFISLCLNRSSRTITSAHLKLLAGFDKAIAALVHHCKNLHTLSISDGGVRSYDFVQTLSSARCARNLTTLRFGVDAPVTMGSVSRLLHELTSLRHVEVHSVVFDGWRDGPGWTAEMPQLQTLTLASSTPNTSLESLGLPSLLLRVPNLLNLTLARFRDVGYPRLALESQCPKLEHLDLGRCNLHNCVLPTPGLPPTVRTLLTNESTNGLLIACPPFALPSPSTHFLPHLEELHIKSAEMANLLLSNVGMLDNMDSVIKERWERDPENMNILRRDPEGLRKLTTLKVELTSGEPQLFSLLSSPRLSDLQTLHLTGNYAINDTVAEIIASTFTDLRTLDLSATSVTGYGVKKIVESCRKLKVLLIRGCMSCSNDAVEWARSKGLKVDSTMIGAERKGKKIRHGF
ncbi:hypothetical protein BDV97DRAFT_370517 [Delphinella strobiligena]|nr:hypothetical protein BDV97DRAFT_370517 [Delphinella strobiligena]